MKLRVAVGAVVLALVAAACGGDSQSEIDVAISRPSAGATVEGNVVTLDVAATNFEIVKADGNTSGRSGHFHVFIDREPVEPGDTIPAAPDVIHSADDPIRIPGLTRGKHTLTVVLGDGTHRRLGNHAAARTVEVTGPTVTATAPAFSPVDKPVPLQLAVEGVRIVKADGDASGATGHLHIFIDKEPVKAGEAVPQGDPAIIHTTATSLDLPPLAAGDHEIWVVVGNGNHIALDPPVMANVKIKAG